MEVFAAFLSTSCCAPSWKPLETREGRIAPVVESWIEECPSPCGDVGLVGSERKGPRRAE